MATFLKQLASTVCRKLVALTPSHIRRLVFWCTLYSRIRNTTEIEKLDGPKLNATMKLATRNDALNFPILTSRLIWADINKCYETAQGALLSVSSKTDAAKSFVSFIPSWLQYGSQEKMERDFYRMVNSHHAIS